MAVLADLAKASTPTPERGRFVQTALRVRISAVTASVALVLVGGAYAVDRLGDPEPAPVGPTHTVDPAGPSEPARPYEERVRDRGTHDSDGEGRAHHPTVSAGKEAQADTGSHDTAVDDGIPVTPAPPVQNPVAPDESVPHGGGPEGSSPPENDSDEAGDSDHETDDGQADRSDRETDADPADPETAPEAGDAQKADAEADAEANAEAARVDRADAEEDHG